MVSDTPATNNGNLVCPIYNCNGRSLMGPNNNLCIYTNTTNGNVTTTISNVCP